MKSAKRARIEKHGWRVGGVQEFVGLSVDEVAFIELKLILSRSLRIRREKLQLSQVALAKQVKSSQSRVAKMEAGDPSVSIDLLIRTLFALGATSREVASVISKSGTTKAASGLDGSPTPYLVAAQSKSRRAR